MADEDERGGGEREGRARRLVAEDVLPDGVARARVEELDAVGGREARQPLEVLARLRRQDGLRPARRVGGVVAEVLERDAA